MMHSLGKVAEPNVTITKAENGYAVILVTKREAPEPVADGATLAVPPYGVGMDDGHDLKLFTYSDKESLIAALAELLP